MQGVITTPYACDLPNGRGCAAMRQRAAAAGTPERLTKRVKGLLNRLAEANVQPTVEEAAGLLQSEGRRPAMQALTRELLQVWELPGLH